MDKKVSNIINALSTQLSNVLSNLICFSKSGNSVRDFSRIQNKNSSPGAETQADVEVQYFISSEKNPISIPAVNFLIF